MVHIQRGDGGGVRFSGSLPENSENLSPPLGINSSTNINNRTRAEEKE
jgi:hypothetical protein